MNSIITNSEPRITSLEIAEITGKNHKDVMRAIRNMEPAWVKVQERKFALSSYSYNLPNGAKKEVACYSLTKTESLYIATKFNDEARAKLVIRWYELEQKEHDRQLQNRLVQQLRDHGYLFKSSTRPVQSYVEQGLFQLKESFFTRKDGRKQACVTTMITAKGQEYFLNLFTPSLF